jgi:carboxymethylenebutenolidase
MKISSEFIRVKAPDSGEIGTLITRPAAEGSFPAVIFYSDIFQLTGPMRRACARLAGYGYVVAAPEIYRRIEPAGLAIPFDDQGRDRGMKDAAETSVAEFDMDRRAVLDHIKTLPYVSDKKLFAAGFCIGGHLSFRAAFEPDIDATVCFYGTGIHNGKLGRDADAGSLERAGEILGKLLMVWGSNDPHVPADGRQKIASALAAANVDVETKYFEAEHAFMRDEGPRYDPETTDRSFAAMIELFSSY